MPGERLELSRPCGPGILSPLCLPFHPPGVFVQRPGREFLPSADLPKVREPAYKGFVCLWQISRRETDLQPLRRRAELNRRIRVLQTLALPLGYGALCFLFNISFCCPVFKNLSCLTAPLLESNSLYSSRTHGLYPFVDLTLPLLCIEILFCQFSVLPI